MRIYINEEVSQIEQTLSIQKSELGKRIILCSLYFVSLAIVFSGVFFSAFSFINNISFNVFGNQIPGVVFGVMVFYLGLRHYLRVVKFHEDIKNATDLVADDKNNKVYLTTSIGILFFELMILYI